MPMLRLNEIGESYFTTGEMEVSVVPWLSCRRLVTVEAPSSSQDPVFKVKTNLETHIQLEVFCSHPDFYRDIPQEEGKDPIMSRIINSSVLARDETVVHDQSIQSDPIFTKIGQPAGDIVIKNATRVLKDMAVIEGRRSASLESNFFPPNRDGELSEEVLTRRIAVSMRNMSNFITEKLPLVIPQMRMADFLLTVSSPDFLARENLLNFYMSKSEIRDRVREILDMVQVSA